MSEDMTTEEVLLALADPAEAAKRQRIRALIEKKRKMMVVQDDILRLKTNLEKESWRFRRERSREAPDDV